MEWDPQFPVVGDRAKVRVAASDMASTSACGRYLSLKVRPEVHAPTWRRFGERAMPFPLGYLADLVQTAHASPEPMSPSAVQTWLRRQMEERSIHRLLRLFLQHAVDNILEAHSAIEDEIGPLRFFTKNPLFGVDTRDRFTVWAPVYQSVDRRTREIRRYRIGSAHEQPHEADIRWAMTAAYVAARLGSTPPARLRVVEIGAADGSISVLLDEPPAAIFARYDSYMMSWKQKLINNSQVAPGRDCGQCKVAGACDALPSLSGMLGQNGPGVQSRSVAPYELEQYRRCPAQWLLQCELKLPQDSESHEAQIRGRAVHRWLKAAHERGVGCHRSDLPKPGEEGGLTAPLSAEEYAMAYSYLRGHVEYCPLNEEAVVLIAADENIRGFDDQAQIVVVTKPDLSFTRAGRPVIREFKTAVELPARGKEEAYSQHSQIPFMLRMLESGLAQHYGAPVATVELEILTPGGSAVWSWDTDHPMTADVAAGDVRRTVEAWHKDTTWMTRPGEHCNWCPVSRWCPDQGREPTSNLTNKKGINPDDLAGMAAHELPPF